MTVLILMLLAAGDAVVIFYPGGCRSRRRLSVLVFESPVCYMEGAAGGAVFIRPDPTRWRQLHALRSICSIVALIRLPSSRPLLPRIPLCSLFVVPVRPALSPLGTEGLGMMTTMTMMMKDEPQVNRLGHMT